MPTVIDTLLVELGLDPKNFNTQQQQVVEQWKKTQEQLRQGAKNAEASGAKIEEVYRKARSQVLAFGAALLGAASVVEFAQKQTKINLEVGRLSTLLDTNVETLSKWRGAIKATGGSAESFDGFVRNLINEFNNFKFTGESSIIPYFRALGVQIADATGHMRPLNDLLLEMSEHVSHMDPSEATTILRRLGADDATIAALIRGRGELEKLLHKQEQIGTITKEDADAARELTQAWNEASQSAESLGRSILTKLTPLLVQGLNAVKRMLTPSDFVSTIASLAGEGAGGGTAQYTAPPEASAPKSPSNSASSKKVFNRADTEAYIRDAAIKRGMDPNVALAVARSEGLGNYVGDRGSSFGPFQLHYGGVAGGGMAVSGLGDTFTRQTGLDARDPSTTQQQIDFALDWAKAHGWSAWHGWRGAPFAGIGAGDVANGSSVTNRRDVHIDNLNVYSAANDAAGIAKDIRGAIADDSYSIQAQQGPQ